MSRYLVAAAAALAVMAGWSAWMQDRGARKEQVRVERIGEKVHARAKAARKAVEKKKPSEVQSALRAYCRDCD